MASYPKLPPIKEIAPPPLPHFPSPFHAAVFRLYETVPAARLAEGLGVSTETVEETARALGLSPQRHTERWDERGYITTIRNAWHLLPYDQLLPVLGMDESTLATVLKEDDFLSTKLGRKPDCPPVSPVPLDAAGEARLAEIRNAVQRACPDLFAGAVPFDFFPDGEELPAGKLAAESGGLRMIYSYCGLYATALDRDISLSYPDALLKKYTATGVNAVWLPAVLYQLCPFPFDESYSVGWEERRERLRALIARAAQYGIKVYLYLNEPRSMPLGFFDAHPDLYGRTEGAYGSLCTSDPRVLRYVGDAVKSLCEDVPGLGGFFLITCSENLTHCKSRRAKEPCPRCKDIPVSRLVSDVIRTVSEASRAVDPTIRTIAWTWSWEDFMTEDELRECIGRIPKEVVIQSNSEARKPFTVGGVSGQVRDYSMSIPGPAPLARRIWQMAEEAGHETSAKVQVNVTWECSTLPFLPVFDLIREHMTGLREVGVRHLMLSWTLGGYPSLNLRVASECLDDPSEARYDALLREEFGEHASVVKRAATLFSEAFREFPFDIATLYKGPQNAGPSNLLYAEPSGYSATMTCYAFDDLDAWRSIYPREVFVRQLRLLSEKWAEGLALLEPLSDLPVKDMAAAAYAIFRSSYLQAQFIECRADGDPAVLRAILKEERELAAEMLRLMQKSALFGYEAANHYYYSKAMLLEKMISCEFLMGD